MTPSGRYQILLRRVRTRLGWAVPCKWFCEGLSCSGAFLALHEVPRHKGCVPAWGHGVAPCRLWDSDATTFPPLLLDCLPPGQASSHFLLISLGDQAFSTSEQPCSSFLCASKTQRCAHPAQNCSGDSSRVTYSSGSWKEPSRGGKREGKGWRALCERKWCAQRC